MMRHFAFKEFDQEGMETLMAISLADKFNEWMFETIKPFCKGEILEIGSGIGNISSLFIKNNSRITLSDVRSNYIAYLNKQFRASPSCKGILNLDLVYPNFDAQYATLLESFDTVFALNVIEHIQDDRRAILNAEKLLRPGGNLIILVPAFQYLYNRFDKELEHFRRYTKRSLTELMASRLKIIHTQYFNVAGIPGWFVSGKILRKKTVPSGQMKVFNKLVPLFKLIDKLLGKKMGLSVIAIAQK